MIERRGFLAVIAGTVADLLFGKPPAAHAAYPANTDLCKVWRAGESDGWRTWQSVRMFELRKGDKFAIISADPDDWRNAYLFEAQSDPWQKVVDGKLDWGITAVGERECLDTSSAPGAKCLATQTPPPAPGAADSGAGVDS